MENVCRNKVWPDSHRDHEGEGVGTLHYLQNTADPADRMLFEFVFRITKLKPFSSVCRFLRVSFPLVSPPEAKIK